MIIDLRSDTVTKPTKGMLDAMMSAPVGDDVFNEDPTVIKLEEELATMFGKESGLFCPSGTMTNQIAIKVHTQPGDEVICDINSHIYNYEGGGIARNSGVQARLLTGDRGRLTAEQIAENINGEYDWLTRTSLVELENTVNRAGGSYYTFNQIEPIAKLCKEKKLGFHLDGARIFNALEETKEAPGQSGKLFDSISICLSKGLGTPAGSVLLGSENFIKEARRVRKTFGGGMRQVGFLAAAGIYALDNNLKRLKEDHSRARAIEKILKGLPYTESILPVDTNILIFNLAGKTLAVDFIENLAKHNIKVAAFGKHTIRMVTHMDFTDDMMTVLEKCLKSL
ncbi:MAG TPA: GntG family PLP-dependent aldolase [Bacteroidia bacterium]|jgi:threonine aldolase|nr:GntG family PLP-dependent aldolase [Bacteroidia bacterium]